MGALSKNRTERAFPQPVRQPHPTTTYLLRVIGQLPVGRKRLLIYLLDLTAVIDISGILINEKYISTNFSRKELAGLAALRAAEAAHGEVMKSADVNAAFIDASRTAMASRSSGPAIWRWPWRLAANC